MEKENMFSTTDDWLEHRRQVEGAEGLWRIGDELYDLDDFANRHPGGERWIRLTKGVDITTAFYSHHVTSTAEELLPSFRVRAAKTPSTEPYTFHEDGFYMTLRRHVRKVLKEKAPLVKKLKSQSKMMADVLVLMTLLTGGIAARYESTWWAIISGLLLALTGGIAHNFFHQRISFRRLYFDLTFMASREWIVSHALSHHLYPNTIKDMEITIFRPVFEFLPHKGKNLAQRYIACIISPLIYASAAHTQFAKRLNKLTWEDAASLAIPITMLLAGASLYVTWKTWTIVLVVCSTYYVAQGLTAGHHHPGIFHDGDTPRKDRDWGLNTLDATSERSDIGLLYPKYPTLAVALEITNFGSHRLHHLFPTVDGAVLPLLEETLEKTIKEMGLKDTECEDGKTTWALIKGKFAQLNRTWRNTRARGSN